MTQPVPYKGGTFLAIAGKIHHLHVVCSDVFFFPYAGQDCVVAVNISSIKEGLPYEDACILHRGDRSFIAHDGYVRYSGMAVMRVSSIQKGIASGEITVLGDVPEAVLARIQLGFSRSSLIPRKYQKILRKLGIIPDSA